MHAQSLDRSICVYARAYMCAIVVVVGSCCSFYRCAMMKLGENLRKTKKTQKNKTKQKSAKR